MHETRSYKRLIDRRAFDGLDHPEIYAIETRRNELKFWRKIASQLNAINNRGGFILCKAHRPWKGK